MGNSLRITAPPDAADRALLTWLTARFRYLDEPAWRREIAAGRLRRNGAIATADDRLAAGDEIVYLPPETPWTGPPVPIVVDDPDFVVVDKPAHAVAHAASAFGDRAFADDVARRCGATTLHFVHRLDRETSGLLLLGKHAAAVRPLQAAFAAGAVRKEYLAVVRGRVGPDAFPIDAPIGRAGDSAIEVRRAAGPAAVDTRPARTDVTVLERFAAHTLVRCLPHTGRTHQLRVHLAHVGHPLAGDPLYGRTDAEYLAYVAHRKAGGGPAWPGRGGPDRHLLHAAHLAFPHPRSGAVVARTCEPPADFAAFVAACRES